MDKSSNDVDSDAKDMQAPEKDSKSDSTEIKSSAVVKYQVAETPSRFLKLTVKTDLNQAPANWLRNSSKLPFTYLPCNSRKAFSSFGMANSFPDCVGEVDVVSDAENIKKLLKIPFSKTHVSMMVHRVGKTLLLDEFDVHNHLLRASQKQWEWLKKFYYEQVLESLHDKCLRKNKSRDHLQYKYMLSKFLHYSTMDETGTAEDSNKNIIVRGEEVEDEDHTMETPKVSSPVRSFISNDLQESHDPPIEKASEEFLRNVVWTFEDITMLIGSDLPIFGGGTRPVVTLRLRDVQKPISVLTGLDYWLDNLMCNVPDVFMCYHLNGIVQQYELIKTEDIPHLEGSHFSPKVVKDVAQNILSFLKAKATKSGHTYWLFRGKNEDVVKLYDLTSLCGETDSERNPFTLPVAMLLYKVAKNMYEGTQARNSEKEGNIKGKAGSKNQATIHKLLLNCLTLLDPKEHPQVVLSIHKLLTNLYIPENMDPNTIGSQNSFFQNSESNQSAKEESESETSSSSSDAEDEELEEQDVSSLEIRTLCVPGKYVIPRNEGQRATLGKDWKERCLAALKHVYQGIECMKYLSIKKPTSEEKSEQEVRYFGSRAESIPLPFEPLEQNRPSKEESQLSQAVQHGNTSLQAPIIAKLMYKGCQAYAALAELSLANMHLGSALRKVKLAFLLYERSKQVAKDATKNSISILPSLLSLAGDCHALLCKESPEGIIAQEGYFRNHSELDIQMTQHCVNNEETYEFSWCWEWPSDSIEKRFLVSYRCYTSAVLALCPSVKRSSPKKEGRDKSRLDRLSIRTANVCNELGIYYMNLAMKTWADLGGIGAAAVANSVPELTLLLRKSREYFLKGLTSFCEVGDKLNQALLHSNLARLARLEASLAVPIHPVSKQRSEFSPTERKKHREAVHQYKKALSLLNGLNQPHLEDNVRWDLCTSLFNAACLLQDYAPLSRNAQEKIEEEVCEWLKGALDLCKESHPNSARHPLYEYRMAGVLHRLASLHHHAYRNQAVDERRQKLHRESADTYYAQSADLFLELGNSQEYLRVLLERIALWEHLIARQTGSSSRVKSLLNVLRHSVTAVPLLRQMCNSLSSTEGKAEDTQGPKEVTSDESHQSKENEETLSSLMLLQDRLGVLVGTLIKAYGTKANTSSHVLKAWTKARDSLNSLNNSEDCHSHARNLLKCLQSIEAALKSS